MCSFFFFFNDTATTEIYTLSLHDALPIYGCPVGVIVQRCIGMRSHMGRQRDGADIDRAARPDGGAPLLAVGRVAGKDGAGGLHGRDRKSTRLNSSHGYTSYAAFCLKNTKQMHCR